MGGYWYHASAMDVENLKAGQDFSELPEAYTIFITENDIFKDGKPFHRIERVDLDGDGMPLFNDGEHILYVNGAFRGDSEIGRLMHDFNCWDPEDMHYREMRDTTRFFKENPEGVEIMCKAFEDTRREAEYHRSVEIAKDLIKEGNMPLEKIASICRLSVENVQELARAKTA